MTGYTPVFMERLSYKDRCFLLQRKFPLPEPQAEEGGPRKWLKVMLKETSLDDIAEEADYAVFEAQQWALEEHLSIRRLIVEQEGCVLDEVHESANESNGEKGSETREWLVKAKRIEEQLSKFLVKAAQVQQMVQENIALEAAEEVEFLQTKTIPTQEAMQELEKWREPLSDEVTSLVKELEVVEPTTQEKLDKLAEEPNAPVIEYVPSLVVFTRKQGTGRRRARICACGNFISSTAATEYEGPRSRSRHSLYAPGLDSTTFRCQVRHAAYMEWIIAGLDISKAFLTAPMNRAQREGRLVVVQPPRAAVKFGSLHKGGAVDCEEGLVRFGRESCSMGGVARSASSRHVLGVKGWTSNELSEVQCRPKSVPYYGTREAGRCKQVGRDNGSLRG